MYLDQKCPICAENLSLLATANEARYVCEKCDKRFTEKEIEESVNERKKGVIGALGGVEFDDPEAN